MRLLERKNTGDVSLTKDLVGDDVPPYAILSHTWGADTEEVTLEDLMKGTGKDKTGHNKIRFCGEQAARDNLQYFWVDTCCIDKSSSAEVSEAINSMFSWYQRADVCYVYLEDFQDPAINKQNESDLGYCRWFGRGWTLQELISPSRVEFYGKDWAHLGSKGEMAAVISKLTGIAEIVLMWPSSIHSVSIANRMFWASRRTTTRIEDVAYSLLGIFGVNMPLLYGEGLRAFKRLQEEIIKISDDESIFAFQNDVQLKLLSDNDPKLGALANHPRDFSRSSGIIPLKSRRQRKPYSMTNKGLHVELPLAPWSRAWQRINHKLAILNCHYEDDFDHYLAIIMDSTDLPETYIRRRTSKLIKVDQSQVAEAELHHIYILGESDAVHRFNYSTCQLVLNFDGKDGYELVPPSNSSTRRWYPEWQALRVYFRSTSQPIQMPFIFRRRDTDKAFLVMFTHYLRLNTARSQIFLAEHMQSTAEWIKRVYDDPFGAYGYIEARSVKLESRAVLVEQGHDSELRELSIQAEVRSGDMLGEQIWILNVRVDVQRCKE